MKLKTKYIYTEIGSAWLRLMSYKNMSYVAKTPDEWRDFKVFKKWVKRNGLHDSAHYDIVRVATEGETLEQHYQMVSAQISNAYLAGCATPTEVGSLLGWSSAKITNVLAFIDDPELWHVRRREKYEKE